MQFLTFWWDWTHALFYTYKTVFDKETGLCYYFLKEICKWYDLRICNTIIQYQHVSNAKMVYQIYCAVCIETGLCLGMGLHTEIVVLVQIWFMAAIYKRIDMIDTKIFSIYKISIQHCQIKIKICPVILFSCVGEADCIILNYAT